MEWRDHIRVSTQGFRVSRMQRVDAPKAHEGVGNALRSAFAPTIHDLPADMIELLAKLD
jgi:hypothetical protein